MSAAAKVISLPLRQEGRNANLLPEVRHQVRGDGRQIAVAKFRELADRLESGELDGARCQWLGNEGATTEMQFVERTADTHAGPNGTGEVRLSVVTIEEV